MGVETSRLSENLSKDDLEFLISHTRFDEATIKKWHKGKVIDAK